MSFRFEQKNTTGVLERRHARTHAELLYPEASLASRSVRIRSISAHSNASSTVRKRSRSTALALAARLSVLTIRFNKLDMRGTKGQGKFIQRDNGWISTASFKAA